MKQFYFFSACLLFSSFTRAQIVINEIASSNFNSYADEDGDYPDWIELYNAGPTAINMSGYSVSDNYNPGQWKFPDTTINANARLILYASGKNRNYLGEPASPVNHWETAISETDTWQYKNGTSAPPSNWNDVDFTAVWSTGEGGFGYGDGDDNTTLPYGNSYYYRKTFNVTDKSKIIKTLLSMDYDDGFVAYINGVEIARINITGTPSYNSYANYWHEALMYGGFRPKQIEIDSALIASTLINGENVLAVEIHQYGAEDATGRTWLHFGISTPDIFFGPNPEWFNYPGTASQLHANFKISNFETITLYNPSGIVIDSIPVTDLQTNNVRTRIPDGGDWCYSDTPTPMAANSGTCYTGYAAPPVITTSPGFYASDTTVAISGGEIHYTTDGSKPSASDALYSTPISFSSTGVLKAIQIEAGKLPSRISTGTYFIDEPTLLPVVSVTANPCDLFNEGPDCIAAYDNSEGWFNRNPNVSVTVEYYDASREKQFVNDFKFECVGNYSISLPQKSMRFESDEDYGSTSEIPYNIFEKDKPGIDFLHGFRVRNMDQDYYGTRMKDITINRIGLPTNSISTAYQNVAVFINGEYWGLYGAREEMDEYFLQENFGVDPQKIDLMKTGWGGEEKTIAEAGSDTGYYALIDFIMNNDMSVPANYAIAKTMVNVENWVDYFATEIFTGNEEWLYILENNIRLFRSYTPDIKWSYMLWDCTNSQFYSGDNVLQGSLSNPNNSVYADMFNALLENTEFFNYFINRFADLMNYYFTEENNNAIIDDLKAEIGPEITAQNERWDSGNYPSWLSSVNSLYTFYGSRNLQQRNQIENYFNLNDQVNITLAVNPPDAGFIQISTIVPKELPWTGVYFDGVPVTLSAIPNPGYTFTNWSNNIFISDTSQITFTNNISDNTTFTANFSGTAIVNPVAITEVNYNSDTSINSGDWVELYNSSDADVNVSSYVLSGKYFYSNYTVPANTVIPANEYLVLAEDSSAFSTQHPEITNVVGNFHFSLGNDSDTITLKDYSNTLLKAFKYYDDRPWPFTANGYGRTMEIKGAYLNAALPSSWFEGCVGGSPGKAYTPCFEDPLIDEINYNSSTLEDAGDWFEIFNMSATDFDLSGWTMKDKNGNQFVVPDGITIGADNYIVFYQDEIKFNYQFPYITNKVGPTNFGFNGQGDVILIYNPAGKLYQSVGFDDEAPYPLSPDGGGTALQIINTALNINDPLNWMASCPEGTPGTEYVMPCATEIETANAPANIYVYPNPASQFITILLSNQQAQKATVHITDISGKNVFTKEISVINSVQVNVSGLAAGIYTVQLVLQNTQYTSSFVKN